MKNAVENPAARPRCAAWGRDPALNAHLTDSSSAVHASTDASASGHTCTVPRNGGPRPQKLLKGGDLGLHANRHAPVRIVVRAKNGHLTVPVEGRHCGSCGKGLKPTTLARLRG